MRHYLETVLQDLRYGARMLLGSKGFTAVALLSLALGASLRRAVELLRLARPAAASA